MIMNSRSSTKPQTVRARDSLGCREPLRKCALVIVMRRSLMTRANLSSLMTRRSSIRPANAYGGEEEKKSAERIEHNIWQVYDRTNPRNQC